MSYQVLLYYKFARIEDHEQFAADHLAFCKEIGVLGRILIAPEGINGTVSGTREQCAAYMEGLKSDPRLADTLFKIDDVEENAFKKIFVRARKDMINLGEGTEHLDPNSLTGAYMSPAEWKERINDPDVVILDGRNDYESEVGHFKGAICPPLKSFRDFPAWIRENLGHAKDKPLLTYCTGGIRCEKLSAFLIEEGFKEVYQLDGGIVTYGKDPEAHGEGWEGACYVFDERVTVPIGTADPGSASTCFFCGTPCGHYVNCSNVDCNKHFICCPACEAEHDHACSPECHAAPRHRLPGQKLIKR